MVHLYKLIKTIAILPIIHINTAQMLSCNDNICDILG